MVIADRVNNIRRVGYDEIYDISHIENEVEEFNKNGYDFTVKITEIIDGEITGQYEYSMGSKSVYHDEYGPRTIKIEVQKCQSSPDEA